MLCRIKSANLSLMWWPEKPADAQPNYDLNTAGKGAACAERILSAHVFVQKCGVIKLVLFSDVVQQMPHCCTGAMFRL